MSHSRQPKVSPRLAMPFGILAVATASLFIRYAQVEASSLVIAAARVTLAVLVLAVPVWWRYRGALRVLSGRQLLLALVAGVALAIHFAAWISSLRYTTVASSVVLVATAPLWVSLVSPWVLRERVGRVVVIGMCLAMVGCGVVAWRDAAGSDAGTISFVCVGPWEIRSAIWGDCLALCGAWSAAAYLVIGRRLRATVSLVPYIFLVYGMAAVVLNLLVLVTGDSPLGYSGQTYVWLVLLALVPQLLGHSTFNWALGYLSATYVSIALLGEPVGSIALAYIFLGEVPSSLMLCGALLILGGIVVAGRGRNDA
jgi:drug/metabolite transporter (DMT)-like permease